MGLKNRRELVKNLEVSDTLWQKIMEESLHGVLQLLDSAKILLDYGGDKAISAGLYTFAVEEYGKILLLRNCNPVAGKVRIKYMEEFRNHKTKFALAIQNLPTECLTIGLIGFGEGFGKGFRRERVMADFESRMAAFYSDFETLEIA